ncbi:ATP-dependent Clp protease ATP-binding subunit ClpA [Moraxella caviae]|uniref:ATP-dependent Clp protease ATP-binding subunit ClpA n=1 Tax=Moraxella caviae TaxID=34060 RepID=A0A1S9ZWL5_9GAMM|nr:ATP-dependent Clp protease ATP-binding subunit ClpA [Moraxella caviae]OOR87845.1 ATP-dependent Clp protease ATP-binding subunit ClpA [Moraxella caviae]STZ14879.1 ATP-dependent Clp protease ATP-binding subunit ClpA [Moraxella caviae]VEW13682.1 ATP-dependent Clp protease ATP-binding subunit ClpA [Moraxella caviae]
MFTPEFERVHHAIENYAKKHRHEYMTVEHLLLGLLDDGRTQELLIDCGADIAQLSDEIKAYLADFVPKLADDAAKPTATKGFGRVIQRAIWHVQSSGSNRLVDGVDVLVAIFKERDSQAAHLLQAQNISTLRVMRYLSHGNSDKLKQASEQDSADGDSAQKPKRTREKKSALASYTANLNERAKAGRIDPLIGRQAEIERTAQILCRRRKNNPLLVGDPGVGKTAIAEGLAWLIETGKAPKPLADCVIHALDLAALIAGTKFRGDFENRMKELLGELKDKPNVILFIDEIHSMIGAGSSMNSHVDVSNLIKPALANGELRCIGSTTFIEYRQIFEKDHALSRRFQKIDINEPSIDDTIAILQGLKEHYETFHQVRYSDEAISAAVELSARYIHERFLPDKAIDVLDEAGANLRLSLGMLEPSSDELNSDKSNSDKSNSDKVNSDKSNADAQTQPADEQSADNQPTDNKPTNEKTDLPVVDLAQIENVVAKIARIPPKTVSSDDVAALQNLERDLKRVVFGQDTAISTLAGAIKLARAGLKPADKPIGAFMFAGPTGVGKTEVCKQLAFTLGLEFVRFDMSEYMEAHTASRLIGAPPGYVGYDQGGLLTEKISQFPHCVLLLDEIEKAHPDVFNLLLQVMDHGTLTDNNGRSVSFKQVILVMTTNVGAESISRASMGFTHQDHTSDTTEAMKRAFTPEFRNRLDAVVNFAPLDPAVIGSVVDKFIVELQSLLADKNVVLTVSAAVREYLGEKGYDRLMGARPMARLIQDELKKPLAELILFGELAGGGEVLAVLDDENEQAELDAASKPADKDAHTHDKSPKICFNVVKSA